MSETIKQVRTRYAPSPTGQLHVGGARTAIFNYLFAKQNIGNFILRIEDTDLNRNIEDTIHFQFDNLKWLNIFPDESFSNPGNTGPYLQSQKLLTYEKIAYQLLEQNKAYRCFCNPEELEKHRTNALANNQTPRYNKYCRNLTQAEIEAKLAADIPYTIRLKIDDSIDYEWDDLIHGHIKIPGSALTDYVILRTNKIPTYNFAVVVDDCDMQITHVLRGEEHLSNTPYQISTYQALDKVKQMPKFAHLSIIVGADGKKLSKRDHTTNQFIQNFRNDGFLPEAVVNFLALLSWSGIENQEIMSIQEMITHFDLTKLSKSPSFFDYKKLLWISGQYFKKIDEKFYLNFVRPFFNIDLGELNDNKNEIALLFKNQISYANELNQLAKNLFNEPDNVERILEQNKDNFLKNRDIFEISLKLLPSHHDEWDQANLRAYLKQIMAQTNKKGADFFMVLRLGLTYSDHGPELFRVIKLMGFNRCQQRLTRILEFLDKI
ncbi:Glutamyl-tRNA synthetase [[Mycoplasma] cavipharyngis]|uniref:glutamate--tRNA ligase n=1 Tax=[Mycoplasma] cavipharyngis TaxID=92757 RepID=UPI00370479AD